MGPKCPKHETMVAGVFNLRGEGINIIRYHQLFFSCEEVIEVRVSSAALGPVFSSIIYTTNGCYPTGDMQRCPWFVPRGRNHEQLWVLGCSNVAEQTEQTEPVSTSGSRGSPMSSNKTQQRQRQRVSSSNCLRLRICSVPSFRSSALPLTVLLLHYIGNGQSVHSIRSTSEGCANQVPIIRWLSVMGQLFHSNHKKRTKHCTPVATNLSQPWLLQQTSGGCQQWQRLLYQQPTLRWGESTSQQPRKLDQIPSSKRSPWRSSLYRAAHLQNQQPTSDLMCQVLPLQTCATQPVMYQNCDCSWL